MFRLGCLFILVPLLELVLLFRLGQWMGVGPTLLLVGLTGVLGAVLARREGMRALMAVQMEFARGRLPTRPLLDGAAVLVGGAFLMTPGVLTDLVGFLLLLPPTRWLLYRWLQALVARGVARGTVRMQFWRAGMSGGAGGGGASPHATGKPRGADRSVDPRSVDPRGGSESDLVDGDRRTRSPRPGEIIQED